MLTSTPAVDTLGDSALLVTFGRRISEADNDRALALAHDLRESEITGIVDIVPAYSSVLVRFDPLRLSEEHLRDAIRSLFAAPFRANAPAGQEHTVPVQYGGEMGPDLAGLALQSGLSAGEAVQLHASRAYRVYFVGFMPGFAYMGEVPPEIATPRLASPRIRIPAGSVGIAGRQTGVYPLASPGGWNLIGRTSVRAWDLQRDRPALFAPGDRVRFVPVETVDEDERDPGRSFEVTSAWPAFRVLEPGGFTTVQDQGRAGHGALGVPQGGAMDPWAADVANALVGNPAGAPLLELTWTGPRLLALRNLCFALYGSDFGCRVGGNRVPTGLSWFVRAGQEIMFERRTESVGLRSYLAVSGGIDAPVILGSRSTFLPAGFGGWGGRALRAGDIVGVVQSSIPPAALAGRRRPAEGGQVDGAAKCVIRVAPFTGPESAGREALGRFLAATWIVGQSADRTGIRLDKSDGTDLGGQGGEVVSFGMVRGAVQLPPGGSPVILGVDHGTTGGYPVLGVVASADWPLVARLTPGDEVRFAETTVEEARSALAADSLKLPSGAARLQS